MADPSDNETRTEQAPAYYSDGQLGSETYEIIYARLYRPMVDFYVSCATTYGGPVLDIGCGTGLVTWAIAEAGLDVVGIDLSAPMLDIASGKTAGLDPSIADRVAFHQADMAAFDLGREFATVIVSGRSFQHLTMPDAQRSALTCIHKHLYTGGMLIMNQFDPKLEYCLPGVAPPVETNEAVDSVTGQRVRRTFLSRSTDPMSQTFTEQVVLEVFGGAGERISHEETSWSLRWTYQQEMRYLFELTGFEVCELYSDLDGAGPAYAKEQIWICRKVRSVYRDTQARLRQIVRPSARKPRRGLQCRKYCMKEPGGSVASRSTDPTC